jgi:tripeptidyl-peptidase-1
MSSSSLLRSHIYSRVLVRFRYGAYLSAEEVDELVRPYPDTLQLISAWLRYHGIRSSSVSTTHGGWLTVTDVPVSQANQLLGASYQLYRNTKTNDTIIRTVGYALPAVLHTHIQTVAPTTHFTSTRVTRQTPRRRSFGAAQAASGKLVTELSHRDDNIRPAILKWLYDTAEYVPSATEQNRLAVVGFQDDFPSQEDFTMFMDHFFVTAPAANIVQVNGAGNDLNFPDRQANAEIQYAAAMAFPTPVVFYRIGGGFVWGPGGVPLVGDAYLEWFNHLLGEPNIPKTISIAFSHHELDLELEYAAALCQQFLVLSERGVSVLASSGDFGVGNGNCRDAQGNVRFRPEFPSSCTCGISSPLPSTRQVQVQVAYQTGMVLQVPGSLVSAAP